MKIKALAKLKPEQGIWITEVDMPELGHNDLLIKIRKTAICGTDVHIYNWDEWSQNTIPVPMVVGHEYVGEVVGIGQEVRGFAIGDRVSGEGHITCGHCRNCRGGRTHLCRNTVGVGVNRTGSFSEYLVIPAFNAFKIPDEISDDLASIFDPFGNAVHTALSFDLVAIEQVLRNYVLADQSNWDQLLAQCSFALNSTVHSSTSVSPFECLYGFSVNLPLDTVLSKLQDMPI